MEKLNLVYNHLTKLLSEIYIWNSIPHSSDLIRQFVIPSLLTAIYAEKLQLQELQFLLDLVCVLWKNHLEFCKRDLTVLLQYL
jgi:hypothetical protein